MAEGNELASEPRRCVVRLRFLDDPPPPPLEWFVPGVIPKAGVTIIAGAAGCGKTALVANLVVAGCTGTRWLELDVNGGPTLWLAAEAAASTERRVRQRTAGAISLPPICFASSVPNLLEDDATDAIIEAIDVANKRLGKVQIVVLDALASAMRSGDENSSRDMTKAMGVLLEVAERRSVTMIVLTHTGKNGDDQTRGHSSVTADATAAFSVTIKKGGMKFLKNIKQRDAEPARDIPFMLVSDGEALRVERAQDADDGYGSMPQSLPENVQCIFNALHSLGEGIHLIETWRCRVYEALLARKSNMKQDALRRAFLDGRKALEKRGLVELVDNTVRVVKPPIGSSLTVVP